MDNELSPNLIAFNKMLSEVYKLEEIDFQIMKKSFPAIYSGYTQDKDNSEVSKMTYSKIAGFYWDADKDMLNNSYDRLE